jgi:hypothetical protein
MDNPPSSLQRCGPEDAHLPACHTRLADLVLKPSYARQASDLRTALLLTLGHSNCLLGAQVPCQLILALTAGVRDELGAERGATVNTGPPAADRCACRSFPRGIPTPLLMYVLPPDPESARVAGSLQMCYEH